MYAVEIFRTNGFERLFFKFKPDEDVESLKEELPKDLDIVFLSQNFDLFESIRRSSPDLVMCSDGSTAVAELFLSGYRNILYKTNFVGYDNFYSDIQKVVSIKVQDLQSFKQEVTDPSDLQKDFKVKKFNWL